MKNLNTMNYNILKSTSIILCLSLSSLLITACQSESGDLYKSSKPNFESQTLENDSENPDINNQGLQKVSLDKLPEVGTVNNLEFKKPQDLIQPENAKLIDIEQTISVKRSVTKPMLDLLFVIDDSNSMDPHQKNLANAMSSFTKELSKLNLLDYRIGVTTIYDSKRYFKRGNPEDDRYKQGVTEFSRLESETINGHVVPIRNFHRLGRLIPITGQNQVNRFATPQTNIKNIEDTLKIGAQEFIKYDEYVQNKSTTTLDSITEVLKVEALGPRFEEVLAPMLGALSLESLIFGEQANHYRNQFPRTSTYDLDNWNPPNSDDSQKEDQWMTFSSQYNQSFIASKSKYEKFVREKAHLGVIFVTDTVDQSVGISPEMAADSLRRLKGDDGSFSKISTYGVLHKNTVSYALQKSQSKEWSRRHCTANNRVDDDVVNNNGFKTPHNLESFLKLTGGQRTVGSNILNICSSNYGANLVQIAKDLFKKSVQRGEYDLNMIPAGTVDVFYKNDPTKKVSVCQSGNENQLCWQILVKAGQRKLILLSQDDLGVQELVIKYQAIDPTTANTLNSGRVGQ
jgi:hypothetical protein